MTPGEGSGVLASERGSVTYWMLGLSLLLLTVGGISVDLWGLMAERRELAVTADAASVAAASAIDEGVWRTTGELVIAPEEARRRALAVIAAQPVADEVVLPPGWLQVEGSGVTVRLETVAEVSLLRLSGIAEVPISAAATAEARVAG